MHDDFEPALDPLELLDGATPQQFSRVFVGAAGEARGDALALAGLLAPASAAVTVAERADLIVAGAAERSLLEGAVCPAAVAPPGFADTADRALRRIVVGLDGGRGSLAALETAHRLSHSHGAALRLIGVAELEADRDPPRADPRELARLSRRLTLAGDGLEDVETDTDVREGLPERILVELAADADLLVLGSRTTYGGGGRLAIGGVADAVLRDSPCSTLIVPAP